MLTSISDYPGYTDLCRRAAEDDAFFQVFREDPTYRAVVTSQLNLKGHDYFTMLEQRGFDLSFFAQLQDHDRLGGPDLEPFGTVGAVAPQTMRYVKVLQDLELLFGSLDGAEIAEIGCGFGGQCAVIAKRHRFRRYTLIDLPDPLRLSQRYLAALQIPNVAFAPLEEIGIAGRYDLVISCYGLSEVVRAFQLMYFQRVVLRAAGGYLLWNNEGMKAHGEWQKQVFGSEMMYWDEVMSVVPGARLAEDAWISQEDKAMDARLILWGTR
jgi:hypothetical protein